MDSNQQVPHDTAITQTEDGPLEARDCRNKRSKYATASKRPPCLHHPPGTLRYQYHQAYDHLLEGTATRKNIHSILFGFEYKTKFDEVCKHVMEYFDKHRDIFLDLHLQSEEAVEPVSGVRQSLVEEVGRKRNDVLWYHKDEKVYVDMALQVFISDSHHTWLKRPDQTNMLPQGGRVEVSDHGTIRATTVRKAPAPALHWPAWLALRLGATIT